MTVSPIEMKNYLRVDFKDVDTPIHLSRRRSVSGYFADD